MNLNLISAQSPAITLAATSTASASVALPSKGNTLVLTNESTSIAFASVGSASQTATLPTGAAAVTCTPIPASTSIAYAIPADSIQNISVITRAGTTATLTAQVGEGL